MKKPLKHRLLSAIFAFWQSPLSIKNRCKKEIYAIKSVEIRCFIGHCEGFLYAYFLLARYFMMADRFTSQIRSNTTIAEMNVLADGTARTKMC